MLVLSSPWCCDKVYESAFYTPMRTGLVLLKRKGLIRQKFKGIQSCYHLFTLLFYHQSETWKKNMIFYRKYLLEHLAGIS